MNELGLDSLYYYLSLKYRYLFENTKTLIFILIVIPVNLKFVVKINL